MRALASEGANVQVRDATPFQTTPLKLTCGRGEVDQVKYLLEHRADPQQTNVHQPLQSWDMTQFPKEIQDVFGPQSWLAALSEKLDGSTPLHWAAMFGNEETAVELLKHVSDGKRRNSAGDTAQSLAVEFHHESVAQHFGRRRMSL